MPRINFTFIWLHLLTTLELDKIVRNIVKAATTGKSEKEQQQQRVK